MTAIAPHHMPFIYVDVDIPAGTTLDEWRRQQRRPRRPRFTFLRRRQR